MVKTTIINNSERSLVPEMSRQSYRKSRDSALETKMNGRELAMVSAIACHNCNRPEHKKKHCNQLNERLKKSSKMENGKRKWC